MTEPSGFWTTEAPLTPEQVAEDMASLKEVVIPQSITVESAEVYVNGRLWRWERLGIAFRDARREASA